MRKSSNSRRLSLSFASVFVLALAVMFGVAPALADAPPTVTIKAPTAVSYTTAHVSGTVDPEGGPSGTSWHFEYTSEPSNEFAWAFADKAFGEIAEGESSGTSPITVEGALEGLTPSAEYSVRLVAENEFGAHHVVTPEPYETFTTKAVAPATVLISTPSSVTARTAHFSGEINPNAPAGNPAAFEVSWHFECTPECPGLSGGTIPADNSSHVVGVDAAGLEPDVEYKVSLVATNAGGSATAGPATTTTLALPPLVQTLDAGSVKATSANLAARINPLNAPVTYQFEWGPTSSYGNVAPATAQALPAANDAYHVVTAPLTGLASATTYHYRIDATNTQTSETTQGVDRTFTTAAPAGLSSGPCANESSRLTFSAGLPDCRVYEWVTPDSNNTALQQFQGVASADGKTFEYTPTDPTDVAVSSSTANVAVARRGPAGWSSETLGTPLVAPVRGFLHEMLATVSPDFTEVVVDTDQPLAGVSSPPTSTGQHNLYVVRADGTAEPLTTTGTTGEVRFEEATPDFTHFFYQVCGVSQLPSDPMTEGCPGDTYEWANGVLSLVGVLPESQTPVAESSLQGTQPVSDDGERVLFSTGGFLSGIVGGQLYMREHSETTIDIGKSQRTVEPDPNATPNPQALGISGDGSRVVFTSKAELTNDANTGSTAGVANDQGNDLYSYDVATGKLSDLTVDDNPADEATGAGVEFFADTGHAVPTGYTHDMSYIYFKATGDLAPGAISGAENFYVEHEGHIRFIASDAHAGNIYLTPDGRHAAFTSVASLTGYDNTNPNTGVAASEAFKFDYEGGLVCVSCRPSGAPPTGNAGFAIGAFSYASNGVPHTLSDDGSRVFFNSTDAVLPQATNGLENAYEYENGEIHLISPGDSNFPSTLVAASASGDDAFFIERGELVPHSSGTVAAIYDARVGAVEPASPAPECSGEDCQGRPSTAPSFGAPSSSFLSGAGNLFSPPAPVTVKKAIKCAKGKKLQHGRCVKVKKKHKKAKSHKGAK